MIYTDNLAITFHSQALVCAGLNLNCAITVDCSLGKYKRSSWPNAADCSGSTPNLSDEVNRNIIQSEIEGGVFLGDLPPSTVLQIHTQHHCYTMLLLGDGNALISGHPQYCPEPILVVIAGSTWGGSMLNGASSVGGCTWSFTTQTHVCDEPVPNLHPLGRHPTTFAVSCSVTDWFALKSHV